MFNGPPVGLLLIIFAFLLAACSAAVAPINSQDDNAPSAAEINSAADEELPELPATENSASDQEFTEIESAPPTTTAPATPTPTKGPKINPRVDVPDDLRVNWLIPFDGIRPVYNPEFAPAENAPLDDNELIIGVAWNGEAKAYPITVLRSREMVNDELAGIPTLVTW